MRFKTCLYKSYSALVGMSPDTETLELVLVQAIELSFLLRRLCNLDILKTLSFACVNSFQMNTSVHYYFVPHMKHLEPEFL